MPNKPKSERITDRPTEDDIARPPSAVHAGPGNSRPQNGRRRPRSRSRPSATTIPATPRNRKRPTEPQCEVPTARGDAARQRYTVSPGGGSTSGKVKRNTAPPPGRFSAQIVPP